MRQYLVLSQIQIQNANSIAGLTWGFPAITHFLGFTHALSRKISHQHAGKYDTELSGCCIVSHTIHNKVYQPKEHASFEFLQSKKPPVLAKNKKGSPPIIEEGKMNLKVSLVIELNKPLVLTDTQIHQFENDVMKLCNHMRVAGGTVLKIEKVKYLSANNQEQYQSQIRKVKRLTMPGFVLLDRSQYLLEHHKTMIDEHRESSGDNRKPELLDAWLDFSALKFKAIPKLKGDQTLPDENTPADWEFVPKPFAGYLIPHMTGYKAISEVYEAGQVLNTRDETTPTCFVEAIHSVGEWRSMHRTNNINDLIWRYHQDGQWYLCKQDDNHLNNQQTLEDQTYSELPNINEVLDLF